ncbi:unnamed protein product [Ranitomeya imitator]|uniref:Integrase catalytic domain-containing protein n=1 Tax=Ranitomeya imitator TaxID=111125 RepID=A0ABN9M2M5_9NEOB|nr:unnamed protein product [Ranitomeya imitator]
MVIKDNHLKSHHFNKFSTWNSLARALVCLIYVARSYKSPSPAIQKPCRGWHHCKLAFTVPNMENAKNVIIRTIQRECYAKELDNLNKGQPVPRDSVLKKLYPIIDQDGLLRIGGHLQEAEVELGEKHPIIIPGHHHVTTQLVQHHHVLVKHQGRLFTEGNLRTAGLWIVGAKRCVSKLIYNCVIYHKFCGRTQKLKMANLTLDRLSTEPPFTNVRLDVFGPWSVVARHTRRVQANAKRWAVMFTCMSIRAVHIEVIESMDTSGFINALRRFIAIRGPMKHISFDRGTNFVGAMKELQIPSNLDTTSVERYLNDQGCTWTFNLPHYSHMGGDRERMIGMARRILDSIFLQAGSARPTHESLTTFLAEVSAIINARSLTSLSSDSGDPTILTPAMFLTQKVLWLAIRQHSVQ